MKSLMRIKPQTILIAISVLSILLRVAAALYMGNQVEPLPGITDQISYSTLALRVLGGHGFTFGENWWPATHAGEPTAHWSFLYTAYLIVVYALFGPNPLVARIIQAVAIGIIQPLLVYRIGRALFGNTAGLVGAAIIAVYTYFIYYGAALMTESFYICAVLATLWFAIRYLQLEEAARVPEAGMPAAGPQTATQKRWMALGLGVSVAAAVLLRQIFLLFVPFLFLWIAWCGRRRLAQTVGNLALSSAILVASILPITIFNYTRFNTFVLLNTNAGFAFFWGNHPVYGTQFESIISPEVSNYLLMLPIELKDERLNEAQLDQELMRRGIEFVLSNPTRYLLLSLSRIPPYFEFLPSADSSLISNLARFTSFGIMWPFMLYGSYLALRDIRHRPFSPAALLIFFSLFYTLIHVLTWTLVRYRLPVDSVMIVMAGAGLLDLYERIWVRRRRALEAGEGGQRP